MDTLHTKATNYFKFSIFISIISLSIFLVIAINHTVYSFDESYTMSLIQYSFTDIWRITSLDVHPPLYYFMLKSYTLIAGETQTAARVFSWLGIVGIFLLGLFPIRRFWNDKVCLSFILLMSVLPVTQYLTVDIRMYSWAMFFVTAASLSAYSIFLKPTMRGYLFLLLTTLSASYTHYYGFIGSMVIFFLLFIVLFLSKKSKTWKPLIAVFFLLLIGFSLWVPALISQIKAVGTHFWITSLTPKDILLFTYYTFSPKEPVHPYLIFSLPTMAIALSLMLLCIGLITLNAIRRYKNNKNRNSILTATCFALVFILTISFAIFYSYIKSPVIIPRYTTTVLGPIIIGFSIISTQMLNDKKEKYMIFISFGLLAILGITRFFAENKYNEDLVNEDYEMRKYIQNRHLSKTTFMSTLSTAGTLGMFTVNYPGNLFFVYSRKKNKGSFKPFRLIEVNKLPKDFDFFYVKNNYLPTDTIARNQDLYFRKSILLDFIITDSLIQKERSIYRFRTIHRDRE